MVHIHVDVTKTHWDLLSYTSTYWFNMLKCFSSQFHMLFPRDWQGPLWVGPCQRALNTFAESGGSRLVAFPTNLKKKKKKKKKKKTTTWGETKSTSLLLKFLSIQSPVLNQNWQLLLTTTQHLPANGLDAGAPGQDQSLGTFFPTPFEG